MDGEQTQRSPGSPSRTAAAPRMSASGVSSMPPPSIMPSATSSTGSGPARIPTRLPSQSSSADVIGNHQHHLSFSVSSAPNGLRPKRATPASSPFRPSSSTYGSQASNGVTLADMAASHSLSQSATPFSWSPTPQPFPFLVGHPSSLPAYQISSPQPEGSEPSTASRTGKVTRGSRGGRKGAGLRGKKQNEAEATSSSTDAYERWDKKRESDGLSAEALLVDWMADGGWRRWKDAKSTGQKDKCYIDLNSHLVDHGFTRRTKDAINFKIRALEDSFKKALTWMHSTGAGTYSLEPDEESQGRSPYQRELDKRCKYYNALVRAFGDRGGMIPNRIYSTLEGDANREAEEDILCALSLKRWDFEEDEERDDDEEANKTDEEHREDDEEGPARKKKRTSTSMSSSSRSGRSTGIIKSEDISYFLTSKGEHEERRLNIEEKNEERRIHLEEKRLKLESRKARAEGIAALVKAGISLAEAKKAWDEESAGSDID